MALRRAVAVRCPSAGLIHHADRGSQYCSVEYQAELRKNGISISMSGKGNCFDNAMVETLLQDPQGRTGLAHPLPEQDRSRERNRPLHRRLLQSRPPPFGARLHQPASVRRAGSVKSKTLSTNAGQVQCAACPQRMLNYHGTLVRKRNDRSRRSAICAAAWIVSGCCVKPGRGDIYPAISRATST